MRNKISWIVMLVTLVSMVSAKEDRDAICEFVDAI